MMQQLPHICLFLFFGGRGLCVPQGIVQDERSDKEETESEEEDDCERREKWKTGHVHKSRFLLNNNHLSKMDWWDWKPKNMKQAGQTHI